MCIAFDIDNVVTDFAEHLRLYILKEYNIIFDASKYYINIPGLQEEDYSQIIKYLVVDKSNEIPVHLDVSDYLQKFYEYLKKPITFITSRGKYARRSTIMYLGNKFPNIEFTVFFSKEFKKEVFLDGFKYFVDDQEKNLFPAIESKIIVKGFLIDRPWNKNIKLIENVQRVSGLEEVWEEFIKLEENK